MKISALWIVKNEEENIESTIRSVADAADELIVVDTGSIDNTVSIAESLGAKVVNFEWINDFSAARNFALDCATGGIVVFLDADEWFEPALAKPDKEQIVKMFSEGDADVVHIPVRSLDEGGNISTSVPLPRIFRKSDNLRYVNNIHEKLIRMDGLHFKTFGAGKWEILHSGYAGKKLEAKSKRNLEFLETLKAEGEELSTLDTFYLMRENYHLGNKEALTYLNELLRSKNKITKFVRESTISTLYFFLALNIAYAARNEISRKELSLNVVEHMKKLLPDYPGTAIAELYYMLLFARDERKFMAALGEYEKAEAKRPAADMQDDYYKLPLQRIYTVAAEAALSRGNKQAAMEYAIKAATCHTSKPKDDLSHIFLKAVKGANEAEIILLLNKVLPLTGDDISEDFLGGLMYENLKNVYLYFFKKQYDAGVMTKARFLYLKILNGDAKGAAETALENRAEMKEDDFGELFFCAIICAGDHEFFRKNEEHLGRYREIAEAYFENRTLTEPNLENITIYVNGYRNIVFAAGSEVGERFLSLFSGSPSFRLIVKCNYYMGGALYDEFLTEEWYSDESGLSLRAQQMFSRCCILSGQYARALSMFKTMYGQNQMDYDILNGISVIAENAESSVKEDAQSFYIEYSAVLEEITDLMDMVNTGIAFDEFTKKEQRALSALSIKDFKQEMFKSDVVTSAPLLDIYMASAELYMEKGMYGMAERYLRRLLVSGYKTQETYARLSEVYGKLGNAALAGELAKSG